MIPTEIKKTGPCELTVSWDDGHTSVFGIKYLRSECMCAGCVNEMTGERMLDAGSIPDDLTITAAEHVGRYGVRFSFSDGHGEGIYTWRRLREICLCPICRPQASQPPRAG
jgi:DUF971 family protein